MVSMQCSCWSTRPVGSQDGCEAAALTPFTPLPSVRLDQSKHLVSPLGSPTYTSNSHSSSFPLQQAVIPSQTSPVPAAGGNSTYAYQMASQQTPHLQPIPPPLPNHPTTFPHSSSPRQVLHHSHHLPHAPHTQHLHHRSHHHQQRSSQQQHRQHQRHQHHQHRQHSFKSSNERHYSHSR